MLIWTTISSISCGWRCVVIWYLSVFVHFQLSAGNIGQIHVKRFFLHYNERCAQWAAATHQWVTNQHYEAAPTHESWIFIFINLYMSESYVSKQLYCTLLLIIPRTYGFGAHFSCPFVRSFVRWVNGIIFDKTTAHLVEHILIFAKSVHNYICN